MSAAVGARPAARARRRRRRLTRNRVEERGLKILRVVGIAFFLAITVLPFLYMVLLSFRTIDQLLQHPNTVIVPLKELSFSAYKNLFKSSDHGGQGFGHLLLNSAFVSLGTVLVTVAVAVPGAYAVSRLDFFGKRPIHFLFLSVYLFPATILAIPLFVFFTRAGLLGSLPVLIVVYAAQTLPVTIYMLRNYLDSVPRSVEEAALVDGCTRLQVIWKISLPLSMPAIVATGMYVFMIAWNEFLYALLFLLESPNHWTVSLGVSQLHNIETPTTVLMAGSVVLTIPVVVLFFLAERLMVEGLTGGAQKG